MNQDFTITAFHEPITALADVPNLSAAELRRRFQAPAEEVRQAHNALCATVKGITDATYPDTVTRDMLTQGVRDELEGKAEAADLTALGTQVAAFGRVVAGQYVGTASSADDSSAITTLDDVTTWQEIELGFCPTLVLIFSQSNILNAFSGTPHRMIYVHRDEPATFVSLYVAQITATGFRVCNISSNSASAYCNRNTTEYGYIAVQ